MSNHTGATVKTKVIIHKRGFVFKFSSKKLWFSHLYFMQILSGDAIIFKRQFFIALENIKRLPSKVTQFTTRSEIFTIANGPKTSQCVLFQKNSSRRDLYIMTLLKNAATIKSCNSQAKIKVKIFLLFQTSAKGRL